MFKETLSAIVISVAIVAAAFLIRPVPSGAFQAIGYDGVVYRLNQKTGRIDALVPTSEGALMMPVGQISSKDNMSDEDKKQFSSFLKTVAQYIQIERAKSLGLKIVPPDSAAAAEKK